MSYQPLNLGTDADDGTGDSLRSGGEKINANFSELFDAKDDLLGKYTDIISAAYGMQLVGEAVVTDSAATSLTVSGLDLAADEEYRLEIDILNASTSGGITVSLYFNDDTTASNYWIQSQAASDSSSSSSRANVASIVGAEASSSVSGRGVLARSVDGYPRTLVQSSRNKPSSLITQWLNHIRSSAENVTSLTLFSSIANALAFGSRVRVYRKAIMPTQKSVRGVAVNTAFFVDTTPASTSASIPSDDTVPQSTEGAEYVTHTYTPKAIGNTLHVRLSGWSSNTTGAASKFALFLDSDTNARASTWGGGGSSSITNNFVLEYVYDIDSLDPQAWSLRFGASAGTTYLLANSSLPSGFFGFSDAVIWSLIEYAPNHSDVKQTRVYASASATVTGSGSRQMTHWDTVDGEDELSAWDATSKQFVVPSDGMYFVKNHVRSTTASTQAAIYVNGSSRFSGAPSLVGSRDTEASGFTKLAAGDVVASWCWASGTITTEGNQPYEFSITGPF